MPVIGLLCAFANAFLEALMDVAGKRSGKAFNKWTASWGQRFFAAIILVPVALLVRPHGFPSDQWFWIATAGSVAINTVTSVLYINAVQTQPLSLVLPLVTLSPVVLLFTSWPINHEMPSALGIVGILLTTCGTYALNLDKASKGVFAPITSLLKNKGTRDMLIVAFLWGVSAPLDKLAIRHADPFWYTAISHSCLTVVLFPFMLRLGQPKLAFSRSGLRYLAPIGILSAASSLFQFVAFSMILVPYAVSIKRTSVLWGVIFGKMFYKEDKFLMRLVAAILMVAGTVLILIAGIR